MPDANPIATALAGAAQSLRDTAKWLVGGVVATAAGVFAGSSLTALGALDPSKDRQRLELAAAGIAVGFVALAVILVFALRVFNRGSFTFRELAAAPAHSTLAAVRLDLLTRYRTRLPAGVADFAAYLVAVDAAYARLQQAAAAHQAADANDQALITAAVANDDIISADAGFSVVRRRYVCLLWALGLMTPLAALGFGLFAWAANPPKPVSPPPAFSLTIQGNGQ